MPSTPAAADGADAHADALRAARLALAQVQARFDAIVSNLPGLVFQFVLRGDGGAAFPYLSEGCAALLGVGAAELQSNPALFAELILPEDRAGYHASMRASALDLSGWNWEGRIRIDAWNDVKWINLRSSPRALPATDAAGAAVQWEGIMTNITASRQEQLEATGSRARLAELTAHIERVKEQERERIAREIHDDLGGNLTAIKMALAMLAARLPSELPQLAERAAYLDQLVDRSIDSVHRITLDLRPSMLDFGIVAALEWQLKEFEKQAEHIACSFTCSDREIDLSADLATALFRIFQEAFTNIAKHARASRVEVRLARLRHHIVLTVRDNGVGISPADRLKPGSFGLRGMSERARGFGGTLALDAADGGGTVLTVKIKLAAPKAPIMAAPTTSSTSSTNSTNSTNAASAPP
ncbi:sensor histidine kinase [Massilia glaciei]|nr:sensor histidine kinase [Massilia glaciei]